MAASGLRISWAMPAARLFEGAHLRQVLKGDDEAGGLAALGLQGRDAVAEPEAEAVGGEAVGLEARVLLAVGGGAERAFDLAGDWAEEDRHVLPA